MGWDGMVMADRPALWAASSDRRKSPGDQRMGSIAISPGFIIRGRERETLDRLTLGGGALVLGRTWASDGVLVLVLVLSLLCLLGSQSVTGWAELHTYDSLFLFR